MLKCIALLGGLAAVASVSLTSAQAQTPPPQPPATAAPVERVAPPAEPNVKMTKPAPATTTDAKAPLEGANSFTEAQAKQRIVDAGYSTVSTLTKDERGVWRGTAMKAGKQANIAVDFKGNVVQMN